MAIRYSFIPVFLFRESRDKSSALFLIESFYRYTQQRSPVDCLFTCLLPAKDFSFLTKEVSDNIDTGQLSLLPYGYTNNDHRCMSTEAVAAELTLMMEAENTLSESWEKPKALAPSAADFARSSVLNIYKEVQRPILSLDKAFATLFADGKLYHLPLATIQGKTVRLLLKQMKAVKKNLSPQILLFPCSDAESFLRSVQALRLLLKKKDIHAESFKSLNLRKLALSSKPYGSIPESYAHRAKRLNMSAYGTNALVNNFSGPECEKKPALSELKDLLLSDISGSALMTDNDFSVQFQHGRFAGFIKNNQPISAPFTAESYALFGSTKKPFTSIGNLSFESRHERGIREKSRLKHASFTVEQTVDSFFRNDAGWFYINVFTTAENIPEDLTYLSLYEIPLWVLDKDETIHVTSIYPDGEKTGCAIRSEEQSITLCGQSFLFEHSGKVLRLFLPEQKTPSAEALTLLVRKTGKTLFCSISLAVYQPNLAAASITAFEQNYLFAMAVGAEERKDSHRGSLAQCWLDLQFS